MPRFEKAFFDLAKWIQLLDDKGNLNWGWFFGPGKETISGMATRRSNMEDTLRDLIDNVPVLPFPGDPDQQNWMAFQGSGNIGVGFTWNTTGDLRMGLASYAKFNPTDNKTLDLSLILRLLHIDSSSSEFKKDDFGSVKLTSHLPTPDFLDSISINGEITPTSPPRLAVIIGDQIKRSRTLDSSTLPATRGWDCIRLLLFVLEAWFHNRDGKGEFYNRVNAHLFPLFGEPQPSILPLFPLFQDIGQDVNFQDWTDSIIQKGDVSDDTSRILTYLWHLHALVTGNNSPSFFNGSVYYPLTKVPGQTLWNDNILPTAKDFQDLGPRPVEAGSYLGVVEDLNYGRSMVLLLQDGLQTTATIPLFSPGGVAPKVSPDDATALSKLSTSKVPLPAYMSLTANSVTFAMPDPLDTIFTEPSYLAGPCNVVLEIASKESVTYTIGSPLGAFPVSDLSPEGAFGNFLHWILNTAGALADPPAVLGTPLKGLLDALTSFFVESALSKNVDSKALADAIKALAAAAIKAAQPDLSLSLGPLVITLNNWPIISASLTLSNLDFGAQADSKDLRVGSLSLSAGVDCSSESVTSASFNLYDVRLPNPAGGATGLEAKLLPDLSSVPGFTLNIAWDTHTLSISGSAKIPVQKNIGPLNIGALYVDVSNKSLDIGIDLSFELGPVLIAVQDLGVTVTFNGGTIGPRLQGLGISLDADVVKLTGMFGKVDKSPKSPDYVGGAVLTVLDLFQLSAIGGYTQTDKGGTSIFVFAALNAPLGGTPFFFITGIACGFGYNRTLPPPGLLNDHPFMKVMNGQLKISADMGSELAQLSDYFTAADGVNWVAGGIQFVTFGFIHGTIIVAVKFGQSFAVDVLGSASLAIEPIVYFEIDIEAAYDGEKFILLAKVAPSSYLIHPDILRLEGSFALGIWNDGDFVLAIGGFHPCFHVPDRYTQAFHALDRVGVKASLFGYINLSVECFFACTNKALMAGAALSLSVDLGWIAAGLDVYVDVLMTWDPFFIMARMGVTVWFEFFGRHEVGVQLQVWTPEFGGTAHISIFVVSFDIDFGKQPLSTDPSPISLAQFISRHLAVPAQGAGQPTLPRFSTADQPGLLRLDIVEGRSSNDQDQSKTAEQEGLSQPIEVKPEFQFRVLSKLPLDNALNIPLCPTLQGLTSILTLSAIKPGPNGKPIDLPIPASAQSEMNAQNFPAAEFGDQLLSVPPGDEDARSQVASIDNTSTVVHLTPGLRVLWSAQLVPAPKDLSSQLASQADKNESVGNQQLYPLPLGPKAGPVAAGRVLAKKIQVPVGMMTIVRPSKAAKEQRLVIAGPPVVTQTAGVFGRTAVVARLRGQTLTKLPQGVAVIAPPASPSRSADLFGVCLRLTRPHAAAPIGRSSPPPPLERRRLRQPMPPAPKPAAATVMPGDAAHFRVDTRTVSSMKVSATGNQVVRTVCLNAFESPVADIYMAAAQGAALPATTRRVICIGEGNIAAVSGGAAPIALESIGVERDTALLVVGGRTFAAHGCVLTSNAMLGEKPELMSTIPGETVLQRSSTLSILLPAVPANWTLAIVVNAQVPQPDIATDQVRWLSSDAGLGSLRTVIASGRAAFLMTIDAAGPWTLQVEVGPQWRVTGVAACDQPVADLAIALGSSRDWNLIDDRFEQPAPGLTAGLTLEVVP